MRIAVQGHPVRGGRVLTGGGTSGMAVVSGENDAVTGLSKPVSGLDATFNAPTTPRAVVTCGVCDSVGRHLRASCVRDGFVASTIGPWTTSALN
jgi:hypothetical protein